MENNQSWKEIVNKTTSGLSSHPTGHVLVVDDEENNRILLRDLLEVQGYKVSEAEDGEQALQKVMESPVDVILLDVMLPKLDGFEVCRRLKRNPQTALIPVLLVTSLADRQDRLMGMEAGANDFLTKPIDAQDVLLRVRNAVGMKQLFDRLQENYRRFQELEALRDNLTHMIVHDLRSPLTGIKLFLEMLQRSARKKLDDIENQYLERVLNSLTILIEMVSSVLDVSRLETGEMPLNLSLCDVRNIATKAIETLGYLANQCKVHLEMPPEPVEIFCDSNLISRVIMNLVGNAITHTPKEGKVQVKVEKKEDQVKVLVIDTGPGIPAEYQKRIFEKFGQVKLEEPNRKYSTGLGLTFCKLAIEAHGGQIGVESKLGQGSTFWFILPVKPEMLNES